MITLLAALTSFVAPSALAQEVVDLPEDVVAPLVPVCPDAPWPGDAWPDRSEEVRRRRPDAVAALEAYVFPPELDWEGDDRLGVRTDGLLVVHQGKIVYERYRAPWTVDTPHATWSVSKSFVSMLVGMAVAEGKLALSDSMCAHLPFEVPEANCAITVQHLLDMASGLRWRETYEGVSPTASSVLAMLYGEGAGHMAQFTATQPLAREPGSAWQYSSGNTNVLAAILRQVLEPEHGERYPWALLFDRIGMEGVAWERDAAGTYVGSSYLMATPRAMARFGFLALHGGCWQGEPLVPTDWMDFSTTLSDAIERAQIPEAGDVAGARHWWTNRTVGSMAEPWCPNHDPALFAALGHWGQSITVLPQHDLVVVRTGDDRDGSYRHDETLTRVLALVEAR